METILPELNHYTLPLVPDVIAGEYPGHWDLDQARHRLRALRQAGITFFLDLTEEGELEPYVNLLTPVENQPSPLPIHRRHPIQDVSVPRRRDEMVKILDTIDRAIAEGHRVYLHCWGGVGRTGTVAGCYLVRHGLSGDAALGEVARLFAQTSKGQGGRQSPETSEQADFVRSWDEASSAPRGGSGVPRSRWEDRLAGALFGLAVGDALGTTLEFKAPGSFQPIENIVGGGPFGLAPGQWTDDTSMALCLAESLVDRHAFDPRDQMNRYLRWYREGYLSSTGRCFDIGGTVRAALERYERTRDPMAGSADPATAGNGSLMRLAPVVIYYAHQPRLVVERAADSSRSTHAAPEAVDACRYFAALLAGAMRGVSKEELLDPGYGPRLQFWQERPLEPSIAAIAAGSYQRQNPPEIRGGSGYVVDTLKAALWAFHTTETFEEGALKAVNLGGDADTTGAVYGQLAGAYYGLEAIPAPWLDVLAGREQIAGLVDGLLKGSTAAAS